MRSSATDNNSVHLKIAALAEPELSRENPLVSPTLQFRRSRRLKNHVALSSLTSLILHHTGIRSAYSQCNPCDSVPDGFAIVPGTGCTQYVSCQGGQAGTSQSCNSGLVFDVNIKGCNWDYQVTCPSDPPGCASSGSGSGSTDADGEGEQVADTGSGSGAQTSCDLPLCTPNQSGRVIVPFTFCNQYVECSMGVPGTIQFCPEGQMYSTQIQACNVVSQVTCPPDPSCPPVVSPTTSPTLPVESDETPDETSVSTPVPTVASTDKPVASADSSSGNESVSFVTPDLLEGIYVIDAHLDANKVMITRELFNGGRPLYHSSPAFNYNSFKSSLHTMITTPIDNKSFFIGSSDLANGRVYGLVNIAAFLSQSLVDSIQYGSCDEVNSDIIQGVLPISNACGQNGMDYQDKSTLCLASEEKYACSVEWDMRVQGQNLGSSPPPFFCGPANEYGGFTGYWDYVSGTEIKDGPTENANGKTDVQGCCWWGRGVIHTRGVCQYGKLNHFLGKKASDEGRPAMFANIDFCMDPGAICSNQKDPDIKWISGLFRWVMDVQTYSAEGFIYMDELVKFVDGGFVDWSFIHRVSGIVSQGCHKPPCVEGAEFDGVVRKDAFVKTLKLFGFKINDPAESSRRLDEVLDRI